MPKSIDGQSGYAALQYEASTFWLESGAVATHCHSIHASSNSVICALHVKTTAAVKAHTDQQAVQSDKASSGVSVEKRQQSAGLQSPGSSVSHGAPSLALSVPAEANRKIFAGKTIFARETCFFQSIQTETFSYKLVVLC